MKMSESARKSEKREISLTRRQVLKTFAVSGAALMLGQAGRLPAAPEDFRARVLAYLAGLRREGGAYGWDDQDEPNLTATWGVLGALAALKQAPPEPPKLAEFIRTHYPKAGEGELRVFTIQQIQSLRWLGNAPAAIRGMEMKSWREKTATAAATVTGWNRPLVYLKQYEPHGWPVFQYMMDAFSGRELLGLPATDLDTPEFKQYLNERRRENGSFNNAPVPDGDGHVMNTLWGLKGLKALGRLEEKKAETIAWLQRCQTAQGGFKYAPQPPLGDVEDVAYAWAAVQALKLLGAAPTDRAGCVKHLLSLWNADGGFADKPGWLSNPVATYYALDALAALEALDAKSFADAAPRPRPEPKALPAGLKVCSIQIEAHGTGSVADVVEMARSLKIDLWGCKNAKPEWIQAAQALADKQKVPVRFFVANEEYGTFVSVPGFGTYSHTADMVAPFGAEAGESFAQKGALGYEDFRRKRIAPLERGGGRMIWQFGENEELCRAYLDDAVVRGGYAAISTFHFGNPDFTYTEPFLQRYRGQIPFVGLQDAHGGEGWWFADRTAGFRTLFLAPAPTWEGWLAALKNNWVVAVRHDTLATAGRTRYHAGSPEVLEFVKKHELEWRWWDNPAIMRPPVSLVVIRPEDQFEAGRPQRGVALRVRCQWEASNMGVPLAPLTELAALTVDGKKVEPQPMPAGARAGLAGKGGKAGKGKKGAKGKKAQAANTATGNKRAEHYYLMETPIPGKHTATAVVRELATGKEMSRTVEFEA
jgi:hypothetical protein